MGYRSFFSLDQWGGENREEVISWCDLPEAYDLLSEPDTLKQLLLEDHLDERKWYDAEDDLRQLARRFPKAVFRVTVSGEDSGDLWRVLGFSGRCECQYVQWPELPQAYCKALAFAGS